MSSIRSQSYGKLDNYYRPVQSHCQCKQVGARNKLMCRSAIASPLLRHCCNADFVAMVSYSECKLS